MKRVAIVTAVVLSGMIPACRQERAYHQPSGDQFLPSTQQQMTPMPAPMPTPADQAPLRAPRTLDDGEALRVPPVPPTDQQADRQIRGFRGPTEF